MPDIQPRIIAYVTTDGCLLCADFEKNQRSLVNKQTSLLKNNTHYHTFLVRKSPPFLAEWLISMGTEDQFFKDGYKAWEYVNLAELVIRRIK